MKLLMKKKTNRPELSPKLRLKDLNKLPSPGLGISTKVISAPIQTTNGWGDFKDAQEHQDNQQVNGSHKSDNKHNAGTNNGWGDFQRTNPWGISQVKEESPVSKKETSNQNKKLEASLNNSENINDETISMEMMPKMDPMHQSQTNPMMWDETTSDVQKFANGEVE